MGKVKKKKTGIKYFGSGSWIDGGVRSDFGEADVIVMPGGGDWNPNLYGQEANAGTYFHDDTDKRQMEMINEAIVRGKLIFGICRGLQGVTIRAGGYLIQDISHPSWHEVVKQNGDTYKMNSCHHQMCYPYELDPSKYDVLSWTEELSGSYITEKEQRMRDFPDIALDTYGYFKEPEVIWYPEINALGTQGHPEWNPGEDALGFLNELVREKLGITE